MNRIQFALIFSVSIPLLLGSTLEIYGDVLDDFAFSPSNMEKYLQNPLDELPIAIHISTPDVSGIAPFLPGVTLGLAARTGNVGGEYITLDNSALLLAGAQTNAMWLIPALVIAAGIGVIVFRRRN